MTNPKSKIQNRKSKILISLGLFLLAFIPRLPDLGRFLTADEFLWIDRSRNFLAGLINPAYQCTTDVEKWAFAEGLACTLRTGHPGVTTMWTGSLGLWLNWLSQGRSSPFFDYLLTVSTNPVDATLIAPSRLGTVIITSLWVVAVYWLSRRLFGGAIALAGALLLALNPFHIALSRVIHHDALSTTFMTLSVLAAFIYWGEAEAAGVRRGYFYRRRWLLLSGSLAGLGFLSKSPALYLMPYIALVGLWASLKQAGASEETPRVSKTLRAFLERWLRSLPGTVGDGLLWFATAALIFCLGWPAMWVAPLETLEMVFFIGSKYATGGHAKGNYFLGGTSQDPGALFYPVTWLYRVSPWVILGVASSLIAWPIYLRLSSRVEAVEPSRAQLFFKRYAPFFRYLPLILLFILGYYLLMTIGEKKQDRYFLPVYPWTDLLAGGGLVLLVDGLGLWLQSSTFRQFSPAAVHRSGLVLLLVALVMTYGAAVINHFPYYFTYYNPLLGGIKGAEQAITIGWGEGLDLAAAYLNRQTQTDQVKVASWYESTFAPFYHGPAISYSKEKGKALAGDYAVFYINQIQRRFPDDVLFDYFKSRFEPQKKIITLQGIEYAWIYPSLGIDHYGPDQYYTGIAALLAWQWAEGDQALTPGETEAFDLYWEYLGKDPAEPFFFRLVDAQGRTWAEGASQLAMGDNPPVEQWREGEIIYEAGQLSLPPAMPPGQYQLQIGFYTRAPAVTAGELLFDLLPEEALVTVGHTPSPSTLPLSMTTIAQPLGSSLNLLAASWPQEPLTPEATLPLELYWRVEQPLRADASLHVGLMNEQGEAKQAWFNLTLAETFNPAETTWQPGDIIHTRWQLQLLPEVTPGTYRVELVLPDDPSQVLPFGQVIVQK